MKVRRCNAIEKFKNFVQFIETIVPNWVVTSILTFVGCEDAYPTRQNVRHMRKIAPGTIPSASGTSLSANAVPLFPKSFPLMPLLRVYA